MPSERNGTTRPEPTFCPTCGVAEARDKAGHHQYGQWLTYRDFEQFLLALGASGSDVQRLWPGETS